MPYIKPEDRMHLAPVLDPLLLEMRSPLRKAGELNYVITRIAMSFMWGRGESYAAYNDIVGALECAKLELYRRRIANYEESKIQENGDVQ